METIVRGLNKKVIGLKIVGAWTDWPKTIKTHRLSDFVGEIKDRKILKAHRRAKYIMIDLSGNPASPKSSAEAGKTLIIHQKISGHLLYGKWKLVKNKHVPDMSGPIKNDKFNSHVRFILYLDNDYQLGLSDLRRFGKVFLGDTDKIEHINEIGKLGPEPLDPKFTFAKFKELIAKRRGVIKKVLMDPFVIAGIGNIYSDEILWHAGIHPLHRIEKLSENNLKNIYKFIRVILKKAINSKGDSMQDFRTLEGKLGNYQNMHRAYQLTGMNCRKKDGGIITRLKVNARSAHFCPMHQI